MEDVDAKKVDDCIDGNERNGQALRPEIRKFIFAWVEENPLLRPVLIIGTLTGLRPQETIALHWKDVIFETKTLSIKKAMKRVVKFNDDWNVIQRGAKIGTTKTKKSVRTIKMPDTVAHVLNEWKIYCQQNGMKSDFVFPNMKTGEMRTYSSLRSLLRRFIAKHSLENEGITLYTLRHTFATVLLEQRENPKIVMELMGHSKIKTTLDQYSHIVDATVFDATAKTLDNVYQSLTQQNPSEAACLAGL
ncbi:MAG: site-specific integrase [Defluviitaleaceae bacterium]|nr:site-specific integrase [Defluviitaleaceae bacterium]